MGGGVCQALQYAFNWAWTFKLYKEVENVTYLVRGQRGQVLEHYLVSTCSRSQKSWIWSRTDSCCVPILFHNLRYNLNCTTRWQHHSGETSTMFLQQVILGVKSGLEGGSAALSDDQSKSNRNVIYYNTLLFALIEIRWLWKSLNLLLHNLHPQKPPEMEMNGNICGL